MQAYVLLNFLKDNFYAYRKKTLGLLIVCAFFLAGMVGCVAGLQTFFGEDRNPVSRLSAVKDNLVTRLEINASIVAADPIRGMIKVESAFAPLGDTVKGENRKLTRDIVLHTNGGGKGEFVLKIRTCGASG